MDLRVEADVEGVVGMFRRAEGRVKPLLEELRRRLGSIVAEKARGRAPVRTGRLRESIFARQTGKGTLSVVAGAPYASFVEYGTRRMKARPFLRPAMAEVEGEIERLTQELVSRLF